MFKIKPLVPVSLTYSKLDENTPLSNLTRSLVRYLHLRPLQHFLNENDFKKHEKIARPNFDDLDNISQIIEQYYQVIPKKIESIEFILDDYTKCISFLISSDLNAYYFKIKLNKDLFIKETKIVSQKLNEEHITETVFNLHYKQVSYNISYIMTIIDFSSSDFATIP